VKFSAKHAQLRSSSNIKVTTAKWVLLLAITLSTTSLIAHSAGLVSFGGLLAHFPNELPRSKKGGLSPWLCNFVNSGFLLEAARDNRESQNLLVCPRFQIHFSPQIRLHERLLYLLKHLNFSFVQLVGNFDFHNCISFSSVSLITDTRSCAGARHSGKTRRAACQGGTEAAFFNLFFTNKIPSKKKLKKTNRSSLTCRGLTIFSEYNGRHARSRVGERDLQHNRSSTSTPANLSFRHTK